MSKGFLAAAIVAACSVFTMNAQACPDGQCGTNSTQSANSSSGAQAGSNSAGYAFGGNSLVDLSNRSINRSTYFGGAPGYLYPMTKDVLLKVSTKNGSLEFGVRCPVGRTNLGFGAGYEPRSGELVLGLNVNTELPHNGTDDCDQAHAQAMKWSGRLFQQVP